MGMRVHVVIVLALLAVGLIVGCGQSGEGGSPEAAVNGFVAAMQKGDTKAAADYFEFTTYARANNEDWDTFPASQKNLIIGKLKQERAAILAGWTSAYSGGAKIGTVSAQGDSATATLQVGSVTQTVQLAKVGGAWRIAEVQ